MQFTEPNNIEQYWKKTADRYPNFISGDILAVSSMRQLHAWDCPFSKYFQILYIFVQIFKYFALCCPFFPFFWKIACMHLLSRIGPVYATLTLQKIQQRRTPAFNHAAADCFFLSRNLYLWMLVTCRCFLIQFVSISNPKSLWGCRFFYRLTWFKYVEIWRNP